VLTVEPSKEHESGPCPCCGGVTRTVWGYVYDAQTPFAVYYARWTRNSPKHGALLFVSMGWGNDAPERVSVACEARAPDGEIGFMVIDSEGTPWGRIAELGRKLSRSEVVDTPIAERAFAVIDSALEHDPRLVDMRTMLEQGAQVAPPPVPTPWRPRGRKRRTKR
jgi:hypothetical protein